MAEIVRMGDLVEEFVEDQTRRHEEWKARQAAPRPARLVKVYRRHNCKRRHRNYRTLAECVWPRAIWVSGNGPYASLAHCRQLTVMLYQSEQEANEALDTIDACGCGGGCYGRHELVRLVDPSEAG